MDRVDFFSSIREFQEAVSQLQLTRQYRDHFRLMEAESTRDDTLLNHQNPTSAENLASTNNPQITPLTSATPSSQSLTETPDEAKNNMANQKLLAQIRAIVDEAIARANGPPGPPGPPGPQGPPGS